MWPNPQETADLVTLTEKILNGKLNFVCSVGFAKTLRQAQLVRCTHICFFDQIGKTMKKLQWIINAVKCFNNSQKWNVYSWIAKYITNFPVSKRYRGDIGFLLDLHRDIDRWLIEIEVTSLYDIFY